jgi:hypothetical protein
LKFSADPKNWYRNNGMILGRERTLKREDHRKENIRTEKIVHANIDVYNFNDINKTFY